MGVDAFPGWGWRVRFLLSAVLVGVGLPVRPRVAQTGVPEAVGEHPDVDAIGTSPPR